MSEEEKLKLAVEAAQKTIHELEEENLIYVIGLIFTSATASLFMLYLSKKHRDAVQLLVANGITP